jgi:serine/threonine protein kinase
MSSPAYYELGTPLGEGGFGSVFRAIHRPTGMQVAVKLLRRADPEALRQLLAEAGAVAKVRHPNVAQLLDVGRTEEGVGFLVMELVTGHDLEHWLDRWPGWDRMSQALLQILDGLSAAHAAGVVHRDLKPPNLLIDDRDGALRLVDFGIAAVLDPLEDSGETTIAGTPEFMAPEQLGGTRNVGPWTDLYAFGVLLHHVVRGGSPFDDTLALPFLLEQKQAYAGSQAPLVREGLTVPRGLHALIDALLAPDPRARPRFAAAVRSELASLAAEVEDRCILGVRSLSSRPLLRQHQTSALTIVSAEHGSVSVQHPSPFTEDAAISQRIPLTRATDEVSHVPRPSIEALGRLPATDDPRFGTTLVRLREQSMVARAPERALLGRLIDEVRASGDVRVLVLLGEPGIGKSRIARWGLAEVERRGVMQSAAVAYELDGVGLGGGLGHLLSRLVGAPGRDPESYAWLAARDPQIDVARLHAFLSPSHATLPTRAQVVDLCRRVLRAASRDAPLYLWIDDLGWAHDGAAELVRGLIEEGGAPILLVATLRSSTAEHTAVRRRLATVLTHPRVTVETLGPLDSEARGALARDAVSLTKALADELAASVDGSPLLLLQLIHDWLEAGFFSPSSDGLQMASGHSVRSALIARPATRALDARIERLLAAFGAQAADAEGVLLRAALLGASFDEPTLRAATTEAGAGARLSDVLDRAVLAGLLRAEDGQLGFEHGLVHENLLGRLANRGDRRGILFDTANGLQAVHGKDRSDVAYAVADLLHRAGRDDTAWDRLLHAVDRAAWNGDVATAASYLETAEAWERAAVAKGQSSRRALLALSTGNMHYLASRYAEATEALNEARGLAVAAGDDGLAVRCDAVLADVAYYEDRYDVSLELARSVRMQTLDAVDTEGALDAVRACHRLSEIEVLRGDLQAAHQLRLECERHAKRTAIPARERIAALGVIEVLVLLGDLAQARHKLDWLERAAAAAADVDHQHAAQEMGAFMALTALATATLSADSGDTDDGALREPAEAARDLLEVRLRSVEALGEAWRITGLRIALALSAALLDDDEATQSEVDALCVAFDRVPHDGPNERAALGYLIAVLSHRGLDASAQACRERYEARRALAKARLGGP